MILKRIRGTGPGVITFIAVLLVALWAGVFIAPLPETRLTSDNSMPLFSLLTRVLKGLPFAVTVLPLIIAAITAIILINFNTRDFFIGERTFFPGFFYVMLTGLFTKLHYLDPALPASFFLLMAIIRMNSSYRIEGVAYSFFDAGILIGVGSLFYANLIWYVLLLVIGILIYRPLGIVETIVSIFGVVTPWALTFSFIYLSGGNIEEHFVSFTQSLFRASAESEISRFEVLMLISAGVVVLVALAFLFGNMGKMKIKSRKTFYLLGYLFAMTIAMFLFIPSASMELAWMLFIPCSYFLSYYFIFARKGIVRDTLFYSLLASTLAMQVFYFL